MRLGYLIPEFPGQTHVFFWREIAALRKMGVEVALLSTRKPSPVSCRHEFASGAVTETRYLFPPKFSQQISWGLAGFHGLSQMVAYLRGLEAAGLYSRVRQLGLLVAAVELLQWTSQKKIEHIHGHSCADAAHVLAMARCAGGAPYSLTLHGDLEIYGVDHRAKMKRAEFVFAVGEHLRTQILDQALLPKCRVFLTCMGVESSKLSTLGKHRTYVDGSLHLVTVARLHPMKGHLYALLALHRGVQQGLDLRYTIAGEGPYREVIRSQIAELGLESRVSLTGTLSEIEVYQLLSIADAFVLPSTGSGEAWPVSIMEAMGAGLPVIASVIGATPEMIKSGTDGFLVPQKDDQALYEVIVLLAKNSAIRQRIGEAARRTAQLRFDVRETAAALRDAVCGRLTSGHRLSQTYGPEIDRTGQG